MAWLRCEHTIRKTRRDYVVRKVLTTIGRSKGNDLVLDDPMVAGTHANLIRAGSQYTVSLTDRTAQLYINGRRVRSASLEAGDTMLMGAWQITFDEGEPDAVSDAADGDGLSLATLKRLVDLSAALMRDTEPDRLFRTVLEGLIDLTNAEKGFLIVFRDGERHLAASHNVGEAALDLSRVSDSIVNQVVEHRQPVIVSDAMRDSRFGRAQSVVDLKLSSVMCVPLIYRNDMFGVLYLGNDSVTDLFGDKDLSVLQLYSTQAAMIVHHALLLNQLRVDNRNLRSQLRQASQGEIIGTSPKMKDVFRVLRRVAPTDLSVLVLGETGTGKELVARELHSMSPRSKGPFIAINCGAIPNDLLESELFGHRKGSFTGAVSDKVGKTEAANGGTLLLDEIGEMPMNLQVKLLRVLQERCIERVGDLTPRPIDIRVVAATNRSLEEMIASGAFREDLFYRVNVVVLDIPPLRDRGTDVLLLAQSFLARFAERERKAIRGIATPAAEKLLAYPWPGNVRELRNCVERAVALAQFDMLTVDDLPEKVRGYRESHVLVAGTSPSELVTMEEVERRYIARVLQAVSGSRTRASQILGLDRKTLYRKIKAYGLDPAGDGDKGV